MPVDVACSAGKPVAAIGHEARISIATTPCHSDSNRRPTRYVSNNVSAAKVSDTARTVTRLVPKALIAAPSSSEWTGMKS